MDNAVFLELEMELQAVPLFVDDVNNMRKVYVLCIMFIENSTFFHFNV